MCGILQAADIQNAAKSNSAIGFSLILQLTGVHGSRQFDKLTKTKTVESILTSMDESGIQRYIDYLLKQVDEEPSASARAKETPLDRTELLRSKPEVVGRFMQVMVPILVDVYAASVSTPVRIKTLTGLLKAVSFLDSEELKRVFTVCICVPCVSNQYLTYILSSLVCPCRKLRIIHYFFQGSSDARHRCPSAC